MTKNHLSARAWRLVKEFAGIYHIPGLDYSSIKKTANISFIIHNFKKYNDKQKTSFIKDMNLYGCTDDLRVEKPIIYKTIASGYKSKEFYEVMALMLQTDPVPIGELKQAFYKNPSLFVYRRLDGSMPPYTRNYRFKFWTHAWCGWRGSWFLEHNINRIYFNYNLLDSIDIRLFSYGRWSVTPPL